MLYEKERRELLSKSKVVGNNTFMGLIGKDDKLSILGAGPCHGSFSSYESRIGVKAALWCPRATNLAMKEVLFKEFNDWITTESPWRDVFLSKGHEEVIDLGFLADTDHPANVVIGAAIASRFPTENYSSESFNPMRNIYAMFRNIGVSVGDAFLLSHFIKKDKRGNLYFNSTCGGHTAFNPNSMTKEGLRAYFDGYVLVNQDKTFKQIGGYSGAVTVHNSFGHSSPDNTFFKSCISKIQPAKSVDMVNLDIFFKEPDNKAFEPTKENIESVISQIKAAVYE